MLRDVDPYVVLPSDNPLNLSIPRVLSSLLYRIIYFFSWSTHEVRVVLVCTALILVVEERWFG